MKRLVLKTLAVLSALTLIVLSLPFSFGGDPGITGMLVKDRERYFHRLKNMRNQEPNNPEHSYQIGNLYYSLQMEDEAIKEYRRVLSLEPNHYNAKWFLSKVLESKGYFEESFWLVRDLIKQKKQDSSLYERAGNLLLKMDQIEVAQEYFDRCDELNFGEKRGRDPVVSKVAPNRGEWKKYFY